MNLTELLYLTAVISGFCIAYQDWSTHCFSSFFLLIFSFLSGYKIVQDFSLVKNLLLNGIFTCLTPFLLSIAFKKSFLGKGDFYLLTIIGSVIPWYEWPNVFVFIGTAGTLWGAIYRYLGFLHFPFAPIIIAISLPYFYPF